MASKAKKSDFLADFVTECRYLAPMLDLMLRERGKFYAVGSDLGLTDAPDPTLLIAWLDETIEDG